MTEVFYNTDCVRRVFAFLVTRCDRLLPNAFVLVAFAIAFVFLLKGDT